MIWMTAREAEKRWGFAEGFVRQSLNRGKLRKYVAEGMARKSEGTWLIADKAMIESYGPEKLEKLHEKE